MIVYGFITVTNKQIKRQTKTIVCFRTILVSFSDNNFKINM